MNKQKILVVDDEPLNIEFMEEILSKDYEIIKAANGAEALTKVEETNPDIILLDIMMPYMNGYAVCRKLKNNNRTASIPVIMVTALKEDEDKIRAVESEADDFLSKPIDIDELRARVKLSLRIKKQDNHSLSTPSNVHLYKVF